METLFEYIFYAGLAVAFLSIIWLLVVLVRGPRRKFWIPLLALLLGLAISAAPAIISKNMTVDLGARDKIVNNDRHLTLTGWDGETYSVLKNRPDTVVLQMANKDVNDDSLQYIADMTKLRDLDLNDAQITDSGLAMIGKLATLESLKIRGAKITDDGFREHIMPLKNLKKLDVRSTGLTSELIDEWKAKVEGRRVLK